jgi:hypothetical protein
MMRLAEPVAVFMKLVLFFLLLPLLILVPDVGWWIVNRSK